MTHAQHIERGITYDPTCPDCNPPHKAERKPVRSEMLNNGYRKWWGVWINPNGRRRMRHIDKNWKPGKD